MPTKDITGMVFGRLTVLRVWIGNRRCRKADVMCKCGKTKTVVRNDLLNGTTRSCGCLQREICTARNYKHGGTDTATYEVWCGMIARCFNPMNKRYADYGGRGIIVCDRWRNSFESFRTDIGERPSNKHQIDRIDNNGNYEPGNCRWATIFEQARNKRNNRLITHNGLSLTIAEWAERLGFKKAILSRILGLGWPDELALTIPAVRGNRLKHHRQGATDTKLLDNTELKP